MADTLESLEIEVKHSATGAAEEINKVASAIQSVSRALNKALPNLKVFSEILNNGSLNVTSNSTTQIAENITNVSGAAAKAQKATKEASKGIREMADSVKRSQKPLDNFVSSLKRIAFYRIIRGIIKSITQAFSEGLEKAYAFSSQMGEDGNRFAAAMDKIKSSGNQMKGQLGSAFISLLTAIEPILEKIINLVIKVADALSQLFAAFTGKTYLKANATAAKFANTMKAGGAAAKEWKNQLLGFDEINRLNEPSNGGGGGGTNPLEGYELVPAQISEFWMRVKEKLEPIINGIKQIFKGLLEFIQGVFMGDWEKAFGGLAKIVDGLANISINTINLIQGAYNSFSKFIQDGVSGLLTYIEETTGVDLSKTREKWNTYCEETRKLVNGWCEDIKKFLRGLGDFLKGAFLGDWETMGQGIQNIIDAAMSFVKRAAESALNWVIQKIDNILALVNSITGADWSVRGWFSRSNELLNRGAFYASGGFPDEGQLFVANESGPEMVGTIGGRTAVAPSNDIVEAVRQGVFDAVMAANANGNNDVNLKVFLDSREIRAGQQRLARAWG